MGSAWIQGDEKQSPPLHEKSGKAMPQNVTQDGNNLCLYLNFLGMSVNVIKPLDLTNVSISSFPCWMMFRCQKCLHYFEVKSVSLKLTCIFHHRSFNTAQHVSTYTFLYQKAEIPICLLVFRPIPPRVNKGVRDPAPLRQCFSLSELSVSIYLS